MTAQRLVIYFGSFRFRPGLTRDPQGHPYIYIQQGIAGAQDRCIAGITACFVT